MTSAEGLWRIVSYIDEDKLLSSDPNLSITRSLVQDAFDELHRDAAEMEFLKGMLGEVADLIIEGLPLGFRECGCGYCKRMRDVVEQMCNPVMPTVPSDEGRGQ